METYERQYEEPLQTNLVTDYKEKSGYGVQASIDGVSYYLGNQRFMIDIKATNLPPSIDTIGTIAYLAREHECIGYLIISDEIKGDAVTTIETLKNHQINTILLTGDTEEVASKVASTVCISTYYSNLLPTNKVERLEDLLASKRSEELVAFVGDGINDAPVIARADIGFAMGGVGSDAR